MLIIRTCVKRLWCSRCLVPPDRYNLGSGHPGPDKEPRTDTGNEFAETGTGHCIDTAQNCSVHEYRDLTGASAGLDTNKCPTQS